MNFSKKTRQKEIDLLKQGTENDLLVIGGGITGAGVALQAAASGIKTVLVDMQDFGGGTSSRSTRLVHGGIRYLKTFDVQVVSDTAKERAVIQHIAPHLVYPDPMLLPIYDEPGTTFTMFSVKVAMDLYDHLAEINKSKQLRKYANYTLTKDEVLEREPQLNPDKLVGAGVYLDYQNNDSRLVIEAVKKAHDEGGIMLSRVKAVKIIHNANNQVVGCRVKDMLTGEEFEIKAKIVINASGPWSDLVKSIDNANTDRPQMRTTKGIHLVVDSSKLQVPQPTYFGSGTDDGRMIFTIPREGKTYFGTTDTDYYGDLEDPRVELEDVSYLLKIINKKYPTANLTIHDVEASWAGLRPLITTEDNITDVVSGASQSVNNSKSPSTVSRGSSLAAGEDGLITLAGGKLTDYRLMAQAALEMIAKKLENDFNKSVILADSKKLIVSGGDFDSENVEESLNKFAEIGESKGLKYEEALSIVRVFGSNATKIFDLLNQFDNVEGFSCAEAAMLRYSLDEEMVLDPVDYLLRRTYHMLFKADTVEEVKKAVLKNMASYLEWDAEELTVRTEELNKAIEESELAYLK
ncbi:FAD-dependent oxidoreductase [Liquorilactobacillus hordei]|uniref:Alpha-glycerophosphate oxidase n=1 Tax=Liquorilactobacillus hordei TaxID=468911 RepID=A0A3Q8CJF4_9LACO|nr:FAD-dependent oxidoreductase [Liquorilactobacillus hordei]AUJ28819.1 alpha-glycerophosphate oxidase [Liquorilactobacillus hordei]